MATLVLGLAIAVFLWFRLIKLRPCRIRSFIRYQRCLTHNCPYLFEEQGHAWYNEEWLNQYG